MLKSLLFVPGDSEKKLSKAAGSAASALILDLEDAVSIDRIDIARGMVTEYLRSRADRTRQQLWVRINPLATPMSMPDLIAAVKGAADGILLPKVESGKDIVALDHYITALEQCYDVTPGTDRIMAVSTETPQALFAFDSYRDESSRLAGLTWGAEDLSTALGASTNRVDSGEYEFTYQLARSMCLLGANAAGVQAIDTLTPDFKDRDRLQREVRASRRAGFTGKIAIHPDQVDLINQGYMPDDEEVRHANAVIAAFERAGGAGAVQLEGKMLDKPHLTQALRVLSMAGAPRS
jgi:citrate lyase subunit beta/citryl-CoA lyase